MKGNTDFIVILNETSHPGNIGSVARAMKTMGITKLRLVNTVSPEHSDAYARSSGADDVLFNAVKYTSLADALKDCNIS